MPSPLREEDLQYITKKVYALYAKHGFDGISMDEVSRQTGISKATLYRYFTSKEDIVRGMVDFLITHLNSIRFAGIESRKDAMDGIRGFYIKSVLIAALSGTSFLAALQNKFPDAYEACVVSMNAMRLRFEEFYRTSVKKGFFRDLPFPLVIRQFSNMLPVILNLNDLEQNGLSLQEALREYYRMFLCQILTEQNLGVTDEEETYDFVPELQDVLRNDFFIDSIRR